MHLKRHWLPLLAVLLLWAFFAQAVTSMVVQSPTVDEEAHLIRGYLYLRTGDPHFRIGHPILADALSGLPVAALADLNLPADDPAYASNNWGDFASYFIWKPGNNVDLIFFLGRLPVVALGLLMAALAFRWARQLWGREAGLVALALFVFDPTIVAHSQLITHDVPVSVFFFTAAYGLWRYLETDRKRDLIFAGVALGLAQASKFAALSLLPIFVAVVGLWPFLGRVARGDWARWLLRHVASLVIIFVIAALTVWATYRFDLRPLSEPLRLGIWNLRFAPFPAPAYFEDLVWETRYFGRDRFFFLCGDYSATGWWYYFPVAFAIKSPLPATLLLGATLVGLIRRSKNGSRLMALLLPAGAYFVATLASPLYIGYRYFIPALPFLYVFAGRLASLFRGRWRLLLAGALVWSAVIAARIYPHHLAYFNELIGGPDNGWRCLVDSNIDWGQDLPALRDVVKRYGLGRIKLSYFGSAYPSYYGLDFEPLPTADLTPERGNPATVTFYPYHPSPGVYAISVTNMRGVALPPEKWDTFAWFRERLPFAKAGYSIFLYRVEPTGSPVDVALSGVQVDEIGTQTFAAWGTNDVRLRWFDARASLVIPPQPVWYILDKGNLALWGWSSTRPCTTTNGQTCRLYPPDPAAHAAALAAVERMRAASRAWSSSAATPSLDQPPSLVELPINLSDQVQFLGYEVESLAPKADRLSLRTAWRMTALPNDPRAIFAHLLAPDGKVVAQWDGLDVPVEGWRLGDTLIQQVSLPLPKDLPGTYGIQVGVYNPETMERLAVLAHGNRIADRILLEPVTLR